MSALESSFLELVRRSGELTFRPNLEDASDLWAECENLYGKGFQYRKEVSEKLLKWFEDSEREHLHDAFEKRIQKAWQDKVLEPLRQICRDQATEGGIAAELAKQDEAA